MEKIFPIIGICAIGIACCVGYIIGLIVYERHKLPSRERKNEVYEAQEYDDDNSLTIEL